MEPSREHWIESNPEREVEEDIRQVDKTIRLHKTDGLQEEIQLTGMEWFF